MAYEVELPRGCRLEYRDDIGDYIVVCEYRLPSGCEVKSSGGYYSIVCVDEVSALYASSIGEGEPQITAQVCVVGKWATPDSRSAGILVLPPGINSREAKACIKVNLPCSSIHQLTALRRQLEEVAKRLTLSTNKSINRHRLNLVVRSIGMIRRLEKMCREAGLA